jgi:hypothetical protein
MKQQYDFAIGFFWADIHVSHLQNLILDVQIQKMHFKRVFYCAKVDVQILERAVLSFCELKPNEQHQK